MEKRNVAAVLAVTLITQNLFPIPAFAQSPYAPTQEKLAKYLGEVISIFEEDGKTPFSFVAWQGRKLPTVVLKSKIPEIFPSEFGYTLAPIVGTPSGAFAGASYVLSVHRMSGETMDDRPLTMTPIRLDFTDASDLGKALQGELASKMVFLKKIRTFVMTDREVERVGKVARGDGRMEGIRFAILGALVVSLLLNTRPGSRLGTALVAGALAFASLAAVGYLTTGGFGDAQIHGKETYTAIESAFRQRIERLDPTTDHELELLAQAYQERMDGLVRGLSSDSGQVLWLNGPPRVAVGVISSIIAILLPTLFFPMLKENRGRTFLTFLVAGGVGGLVGILSAYLSARPLRTSDDIDAAVDAEFARLLAQIGR